ncbi:MAG: PAC2 family protein [Acidimicrobiia bacterium]
MAPLLDVDNWPELDDPIFVAVLSGWVDAGAAGSGGLAVIDGQLTARREFAKIDLADLMDLQQTRPSVHLAGGLTREITWPSIEFVAGHLGHDVVLCHGPEPSLRWRAILGEIAEAASRLGVTRAFTLGGIPSMASHRRAIQVMSTASSPDLLDVPTAWRSDYTGPTGAQTVLQVLLGEVGIPTMSLWAQVPHYVSAGPSPPSMRAVLAKLRELSGLTIDLGELDDQAAAYVRRVEESIAERPDVVAAIDAIESDTSDTTTFAQALDEGELPSGDELASEIEKFLRGQG